MDLLTKVTIVVVRQFIIRNVAGSQQTELDTVKTTLIKTLS
jgi:hypothetical protein